MQTFGRGAWPLRGSEVEGRGTVVYNSGGQVLDSQNQSPWRLSFTTDFFWGIVEFVVLFFKSRLQQDVKNEEVMEAHLSPDTMMEEGHRETLPKEWVESVIFMALVLLQWLVNICSKKHSRHAHSEKETIRK